MNINTAKEIIRKLFANNETAKAVAKVKEMTNALYESGDLAEMLSFTIWAKNAAWEFKKMVLEI